MESCPIQRLTGFSSNRAASPAIAGPDATSRQSEVSTIQSTMTNHGSPSESQERSLYGPFSGQELPPPYSAQDPLTPILVPASTATIPANTALAIIPGVDLQEFVITDSVVTDPVWMQATDVPICDCGLRRYMCSAHRLQNSQLTMPLATVDNSVAGQSMMVEIEGNFTSPSWTADTDTAQ